MKHKYINLANILTFSRMILGFVFLFLFLITNYYDFSYWTLMFLKITSFIVFIIAIITDGLDGYYARKHNHVTNFGKHFDPLSDSIFFIIVFFTFWTIKLMPIYLFIIIVLREGFMHLFLRPYVKSKGKYLQASIYGKIKTIFQSVFSLMILFGLIINDIFQISHLSQKFITNYIGIINTTSLIFFIIIAFLSVISLIIYLLNLNKQLPSS